jgi:hypothetical protein
VSATLNHALEYAVNGIAVFPVHYPIDNGCSCQLGPRCTHIGKHPATARGFVAATTDVNVLRSMWRDRPYNIGAVTGNLFDVLDNDPAHGGDESLARLEVAYGKLPETAQSKTGGGGRHFFYQHIEGVKNNNTGKVGQGLDFKTTGGYVVMPPSLHRSGMRYEWIDPEIPIVPAPEWLVEVLRREFPSGKPERKPDGFWESISNGVIAGDRHNAVASVAGLLLTGSKFNVRLAIRLIHGFNTECCDPPKSREEVNSIIAYVLKKNTK